MHIVTYNNEMAVASARHEGARTVLDQADGFTRDSYGLGLASWLGLVSPAPRCTGRDIVGQACAWAREHDRTIALIGGAGDDAFRARDYLMAHTDAPAVLAAPGGVYDPTTRLFEDNQAVLDMIASGRPVAVFVALGFPAQDEWIIAHKDFLARCGVMLVVGVGGVIAMLAGSQSTAPFIFRALGLEWLWRVMGEPWRMGRIYRALIVFPLLCVRQYMKK